MEHGAISHRQVLRFVWRHTAGHRGRLLVIFLLTICVTAFSLAQPLFFKAAIDVISNGDATKYAVYNYARWMIIAGTTCVGFGMMLEQWSYLLLGRTEAAIMRNIHSEGFAKVQQLSTDFHVNAFAGSTARKITRGVDAMETIFDKFIQTFLPAITITIGFMIVLGIYAPTIGIIILCGIAIYATFSIGANMYLLRYYAKVDRQDTRLTGNLVDAITANTVVKSFGAEQREVTHQDGLLIEWKRRIERVWELSTIFTIIQFSMLIALEVAIMLVSLHLWRRGIFTAGSFVVVIVYIWQLWSKLWDIGRSARHYMQASSRCAELVEIMERPLTVENAQRAKKLAVTKGRVTFEHVDFRYENQDRAVFSDFSLSINPGETIALVGHSGGGKSTIVKLLLRLYDIEKGSITIDGQNIASITLESLRKAIGLVPQEPILFHRSIAHNIAYGKPSATKAEIEKAAKLAHAHEFIKDLPKGYDTLVGERGVKLSGGERQRVAIARAILADAPLLVLDEATSSLDSLSERYIHDALDYLMKNRTTIVIAHRLSTIKRADRIIVLKKGIIAEQGSHTELLKIKGGIYKHLYELQAGGFIGS